MEWEYFVLGIIAAQILKMLYLIATKEIQRRQEKRFLKLVKVVFPDNLVITFTTIETSDRRALRDLEEQVLGYAAEVDEFKMEDFPPREP